jgi:hypothetical protein
MPVPRKVWLQTSVVMPAALARRRTMAQAFVRWSRTPLRNAYQLSALVALVAASQWVDFGEGRFGVKSVDRGRRNDTRTALPLSPHLRTCPGVTD